MIWFPVSLQAWFALQIVARLQFPCADEGDHPTNRSVSEAISRGRFMSVDLFPGWWFQTFIFHFIYGMSSFPLTHIFQRGRSTTNQFLNGTAGNWNIGLFTTILLILPVSGFLP